MQVRPWRKGELQRAERQPQLREGRSGEGHPRSAEAGSTGNGEHDPQAFGVGAKMGGSGSAMALHGIECGVMDLAVTFYACLACADAVFVPKRVTPEYPCER